MRFPSSFLLYASLELGGLSVDTCSGSFLVSVTVMVEVVVTVMVAEEAVAIGIVHLLAEEAETAMVVVAVEDILNAGETTTRGAI